MAITQEKADRIAQEYAKTGYLNKRQALENTGYSKAYSRAIGLKLYDNVCVKEAIANKMAEYAAKVGITIESVINMVVDTHARAKKANNHTAEIRAEDVLMRYLGGYELDNAQKTEKTVLDAEQQAMYDDYLAYRRRMLLKETG